MMAVLQRAKLRLAGPVLLLLLLVYLYVGMEFEEVLKVVTMEFKMTTRGAMLLALDLLFQDGCALEEQVQLLILVSQPVGMASWLGQKPVTTVLMTVLAAYQVV